MPFALACSDFSPRADQALARAALLSRSFDLRVAALTVVADDARPEDPDAPSAEALRLEARRAEAAGRLRQSCDAVGLTQAEIRTRLGDAASVIIEEAETERADLILLGAHRPRLWTDMIRATVAERVVSAARRPVLVVAREPKTAYRSVLVATDFSEASAAALRAARRWAGSAPLHAFHAFHTPYRSGGGGAHEAAFRREAEAARDAWAAADGVEPPELISGSVTEALERMLRAHAPDLLALGAHGRGRFNPTLLGGFAEAVLRDPPCDLLIQSGD